MSERFVYDNQEVKKTGRRAVKNSQPKARRSDRTPSNQDMLFEITPANSEDGTWKRWVRQTDLYEIIEQQEVN